MNIFKKLKSKAKVGADKIKKYSPEILIGLGIISFGATIYTTAKAAIKVKEVSEEEAELLVATDVAVGLNKVNPDGTLYSKEDCENDKKIIGVQYNLKKVKAILPAATSAALAISCFLVAFKIMKARYLVLQTAYKGLEASYNFLYNNVKEEYGEEKAFELANGVKKVGEDESGNAVYEKTNPDAPTAPYVEYITPSTCKYWSRNEWENDFFLEGIERNANELGRASGYLLYHDLCKELGLRLIKPMSVRAGWVFDDARRRKAMADGLNPDGFVDLRITKIHYNDECDKIAEMPTSEEREVAADKLDELFYNPGTGQYEDYIYMINPNVDGEIYTYI